MVLLFLGVLCVQGKGDGEQGGKGDWAEGQRRWGAREQGGEGESLCY